MKRLALLLLLAAILLWTGSDGTALAGSPSADPRQTQLADDVDLGDIVMTEIERRLIRNYYERNYSRYVEEGGHGNGNNKNKTIPPGIAKKGWLPPGIAKQIAAGQRVPNGVILYPLPYDLRTQLPYRAGYNYYIADDKVLLVRSATNLILDVLTVAAIEALN